MKYPKKYVVMPIDRISNDKSDLSEPEIDYNVIGYIASECYLISERKIYLGEDDYRIKYEIVYTFDPRNNEEVVPEYNNNGGCYNSYLVSNIFDDAESAKRYSRELNKRLKMHEMAYYSTLSSFHLMEQQINARFEYLYQIEDKYLERNNRKVKKLTKEEN